MNNVLDTKTPKYGTHSGHTKGVTNMIWVVAKPSSCTAGFAQEHFLLED